MFGIPAKPLEVTAAGDDCQNAHALLTCNVDLRGQAGTEWPRGSWATVDKIHERGTFKSLAWLLERIRHVDDKLQAWQQIENIGDHFDCDRCAPTPPDLRWVLSKGKTVPVEDSIQAGEYERRLKSRPNPFVTQLKLDEGWDRCSASRH